MMTEGLVWLCLGKARATGERSVWRFETSMEVRFRDDGFQCRISCRISHTFESWRKIDKGPRSGSFLQSPRCLRSSLSKPSTTATFCGTKTEPRTGVHHGYRRTPPPVARYQRSNNPHSISIQLHCIKTLSSAKSVTVRRDDSDPSVCDLTTKIPYWQLASHKDPP